MFSGLQQSRNAKGTWGGTGEVNIASWDLVLVHYRVLCISL